jgi:type I restriction enzyme S subunit
MREMKDTGVVWCPTIPKEWHIEKVKNYFYISKDLATETNPTVLKLARSGICVKDVTTNEGQMAESYDNYNKVKAGDLLLNPMDLYSGANCNVSEIEGVISPAYTNLRLKASANSKFYDYYFKTQYWAMAMFAHGKGVSYDNRWTINAEGVKNYEIPVPSIEEQNAIVESIQRDTAKVDALIANQEAQIEKLKAYKQSLITEVVTKGLDPNVPMKDSGVKWIGEIPKHWNACKATRFIQNTQNGLTRRDLSESSGHIVLKLKNISADGEIDYSDINRINLTEKEIQTYSLIDGDFLFVRVNGSRALVGKCAIFNSRDSIVAYNDHIIRVRLLPLMNRYYYRYYLLSSCGKTEVELHTVTSAGQFTISGSGLRDVWTVLPPIDEQERIVDYLDAKCSQIDRLIVIKQEKIEKLNQYKKSLIYEYITGKKEV